MEPLDRFILYVIPKPCALGKGVNSVLSFLDHCLKTFTVGEKCVKFHADNCIGLNKNNYTIQYLTSLVKTQKKYESVEFSCMPVGHTKFRVDACFGTFKTKWNHSEAHCLKDVVCIATQMKNTCVILVGDEKGKTTYLPQSNWIGLFEKTPGLKKVPKIRSMHHFRTTNTEPGVVYSKETLHGEEFRTEVIPAAIDVGTPEILSLAQITDARKKYTVNSA